MKACEDLLGVRVPRSGANSLLILGQKREKWAARGGKRKDCETPSGEELYKPLTRVPSFLVEAVSCNDTEMKKMAVHFSRFLPCQDLL